MEKEEQKRQLVEALSALAERERGPFLVAQAWSRHLLSEVKLSAPGGCELPRPVLLHHLGLDDQVVVAVDWWELDRTLEPDHLTSLYVPDLPGAGVAEEMTRLAALMDTSPLSIASTSSGVPSAITVSACFIVLLLPKPAFTTVGLAVGPF